MSAKLIYEGHCYVCFFVAITSGKVSMALEEPKTLRELFLLLCGHPVLITYGTLNITDLRAELALFSVFECYLC